MSISQNFPAISPTLNLNFARSKKLDPRITFTRTSSATRTNAQGLIEVVSANTPRFEHSYNSSSGSVDSLGLLIEESRTNLCLYSQAISTAPWSANGTETCVASTLTDPAGGTSAFKINTPGPDAFERWQQPITVVNGTTYTLSAWVRSTTGTTQFRLRFTGGVASSDLTATTTWQRFNFTLTAGTTSGFFAFNAPSSGAATEIHVWGAQLEAGAFPTSYIPTVASTVTRSADNASITGTNFSSFYNPSEGTTSVNSISKTSGVYCTMNNSSYSERTFSMSVGSANNYEGYFISSSSIQASCTLGSNLSGVACKTISSGKTNDFAFCLNGGSVTTDASGTYGTGIDRMNIGKYDVGNAYCNGTISQLSYYPVRLSNSQLQTLTK